MGRGLKCLKAFAVLLLLSGCGSENSDPFRNIINAPQSNEPAGILASLQVCSKLSFDGVYWPSHLSSFDQEVFKLTLNITGSYEGNEGWINISNNFDGTGLSLGLLNQTLGTGTLQPLMQTMRENHNFKWQQIFAIARRQSLEKMLDDWFGVVTLKSFNDLQQNDVEVLSPLDKEAGSLQTMAAGGSAVDWAEQNLYQANGKFKPEWRTELRSLAKVPEYVSLQIEATVGYLESAKKYYSQFTLTQVRAMAMLFDVVVQNGGFYSSDISSYKTFLKNNPRATETQKLNKLLELRLTHVRSQYVEDVRLRKRAIIDGKGLVHGANRNLEKEYCYAGNVLY